MSTCISSGNSMYSRLSGIPSLSSSSSTASVKPSSIEYQHNLFCKLPRLIWTLIWVDISPEAGRDEAREEEDPQQDDQLVHVLRLAWDWGRCGTREWRVQLTGCSPGRVTSYNQEEATHCWPPTTPSPSHVSGDSCWSNQDGVYCSPWTAWTAVTFFRLVHPASPLWHRRNLTTRKLKNNLNIRKKKATWQFFNNLYNFPRSCCI